MVALTLGAVLSVVVNTFLSTIYYINELLRRLGFPPLVLFFLAGVLLWDSNNEILGGNYIGQLLSMGTNYFWGITISSFTLFMVVIAVICIWFMKNVHDTFIK